MPKPSKLKPYRFLINAFIQLEKRLRKRPGHITFSGRQDGIGAQIHAVFSLHAYAYLRNMNYYSRPLKNISHNYDDDPEWDFKWNEFFNIPHDEEVPPMELLPVEFKPKRVGRIKPRCIYQALRAHPVTDLFPEAYDAVMPRLRQSYFQSKFPRKSVFKENVLKIAVHLRRGDAFKFKGRASNLSEIYEHLRKIKSILESEKRDYSIMIFSQGDREEFDILESLGVEYYLNGNLFDTFHSLVTADVLVTARSSLSHSAALLSKGIIIHTPFWHTPMKHWLSLGDRLAERLKIKIRGYEQHNKT